jgi:hypothetical protein
VRFKHTFDGDSSWERLLAFYAFRPMPSETPLAHIAQF